MNDSDKPIKPENCGLFFLHLQLIQSLFKHFNWKILHIHDRDKKDRQKSVLNPRLTTAKAFGVI